ncbi:MAG TPA: YheV family putative zinc ribbon protein [Cellvibrionaceae bacterium]|nr:YheV family putative zinc ribbon protein [Cellvibrionaceae bacterium]HMW46826.1 YheV family putative zinc ribbon protein [Cellvibrionaceae bacterium]HMY38909.1 YheV family putative zinc ribbon protein [Marinagarivorans sp.]HNG58534.1 YheV family putative zinc ribbon protein [Cellvibrionaceae bacterium]
MTAPIKKRFIAGAVCPKCASMDTVFTYRFDDKDWRGCVNCDFNEAMMFTPQVRELETRVNLDEATKAAQTQVIKILK